MSVKRCLLLEGIMENDKIDVFVLRNFISDKFSTPKPPKKEYLRCKIIRGHKRATRQIIKGKTPKATIHKFAIENSRSLDVWYSLKSIIDQNPNLFIDCSNTVSGPKTDGQAKRKNSEGIEKSFNIAFCSNYFSNEKVRESYYYYIQLLFTNFNLTELCEKFNFKCCEGSPHKINCVEKWIMLKEYLEYHLIKELDLEPFVLDLSISGLPSYDDVNEFINQKDK
ncbi:hypothetical protein SteCoe_31880 [Stentor coeruleus]|uniref:Uncharacterized protein n=1 Tax=Stentor coeruleus TaxID=5963 RepID=A0A1R2B0B5_9CILI|nr:hypothetical protein SteCoe_31880 [Stentor coeruleus]